MLYSYTISEKNEKKMIMVIHLTLKCCFFSVYDYGKKKGKRYPGLFLNKCSL